MKEFTFELEETPAAFEFEKTTPAGGGGTSDYNELQNRPSINGQQLEGNKTAEALGLVDAATLAAIKAAIEAEVAKKVNDILIGGATIVNDEGVANIPIANSGTNGRVGLVKTETYLGLSLDSKTGNMSLYKCGNSHIDDRDNRCFAINTQNYDRAVKNHLTDGKATEYTSEEKANARARMGVDLKPLFTEPIILENDLTGAMNIELLAPCEKVLMLVKQPSGTTPITLYSGIFFEGQQGTGAGSLLGSVTTVAGKYVAYEMTVLIDGIVECTNKFNSTVKYDQTVLNQYTDYIDKKIAKVGLSSISATLPKGTEIILLGK